MTKDYEDVVYECGLDRLRSSPVSPICRSRSHFEELPPFMIHDDDNLQLQCVDDQPQEAAAYVSTPRNPVPTPITPTPTVQAPVTLTPTVPAPATITLTPNVWAPVTPTPTVPAPITLTPTVLAPSLTCTRCSNVHFRTRRFRVSQSRCK